jgi:hypothetical protein
VDVVQTPENLPDQPGDDHQPDRGREQVRGQGEHAAGFSDPAQVAVAHDEDGENRDDGQDPLRADARDVAERGKCRHDGRTAGRGLHRDRNHVVDEQCHRRYLGDPRPEVFPGHDVGAAGPGVDRHHLAVGEHHDDDAEQHHQRHRYDQVEGRQAHCADQHDEHFLGPVRGRGDAVA